MTAEATGVRIRRMGFGDVERVHMIGWSRKHAPRWPKAAYHLAAKPEGTPKRIALVAENSIEHLRDLVVDWNSPGFQEMEQPSTNQGGESSGRVVGFLVARVVGEQAELESLAVSASMERRGIGRKLLEAMEEKLMALGVEEVFLEVRASNLGAHAFYRSVGWLETGRRPRYYSDPEEDALLMSLKRGEALTSALNQG